MTLAEVERAVARQTGESLATIRRYGFQLNMVPVRPPLVIAWDDTLEIRPVRRRVRLRRRVAG